ncbi:MAG: DUF1295 domain-containing protein [Saprospiraceae bacterium]
MMWRTSILLIIAVIVIPVGTYYFDSPIPEFQLNTLKDLFQYMLIVAALCFLISELSKNYSQVDKLWSILPIFYTLKVWPDSGYSLRLGIMFALVFLWGIRLTYNFSRRGAYHWLPWKGEEDYRWQILRKKPGLNNPWTWRLFNLFFISLYQNTLILLFTLPTIVAWQGNREINYLDYIAIAGMLFFIILETIADQQQFEFQSKKYELIKNNQALPYPYSDGFCSQGLWSKMRHPNYLSEQAIWICFYLFSVAASGRWWNWSAAGFILLLLLFKGSADFSESISLEKYPKYKDYQLSTARFLPFKFKR